VGSRLARAAPPALRYGLAEAGGQVWYAVSRGQRRNALANYAAALGLPEDDPEVARVARRAFANYGSMLMDFVLMGSMSPQELRERVTISGLEHIDAALEKGLGVILAVPHLGSWDVGGSYAGAIGYRICAVADPFPGSLDQAVVATRQTFGLRVIPIGRSAVRAITEALAGNELVCLLCDLPHGPGVEVEFFGRQATVPGGPASFALKTGAPLMPGCVYRTAPGRYHVELQAPLEISVLTRGTSKDAVQRIMQSVVLRLEGFIRPRPEQWYAFRPMFQKALVPAA
jgi:KDO2-lipid IV(A) lauroyltransferase